MTCRAVAPVLMTGLLAFGVAPLPGSGLLGSAHAQDAVAKIKSLEDKVAAARTAVETDAPLNHVQGSCNLAWVDIKQMNEQFADDETVLGATAEASEACDFEVPVAFFAKSLDATDCDTFIGEVQTYFEQYRFFALGWWFGDGTPEQQAKSGAVLSRFKSALSGQVTEACPAQAELNGF